MAFHADFWVVVGTASPIFSLAAIAAAGDARTIKYSGVAKRRREKPYNGYARPLYFNSVYVLILQALALLLALLSLANDRDAFSLAWVTGTELASISILLLGSILAQVYRKRFGAKAEE